MIAPDDLDLEIRRLVDLAGADAPPAPDLALTGVPGRLWPLRRTLGTAAALILVIASVGIALALRPDAELVDSVNSASSTLASDAATTTLEDTPAKINTAEPIATLELPALNNLRVAVYSGVGADSLTKGAGHQPWTPMPGELGNSVIEGHRTAYGQEFVDLDQLGAGDRLLVTTAAGGGYEYIVINTYIDAPDADLGLPVRADGASLTLFTCAPKFSARQRLTVYAELDPAASDAPTPPVEVTDPTSIAPETENALPC